jgi:two-component system cell cycle response regulator DivK
MNILIVDDHPSGRELTVEALRPLGYELIEAGSADIAVRLAREEQPALILLDIRMPSVDGFAAIHALREDPMTTNICIVAFTACAMRGEKQAAIEAGFDGCLTKPIPMAALREEVLRYLSRSGAAGARGSESRHTQPKNELKRACAAGTGQSAHAFVYQG